MAIGMAQRDVPVHVINEYCHPSRSFNPTPVFKVNEDTLPRETKYNDYGTSIVGNLFPLMVSDSSGLGVDFSLCSAGVGSWALDENGRRCGGGAQIGTPRDDGTESADLAAVIHLDVVRTDELKQSLEILGKKPMIPEPSFDCRQ